ncbi:fasciclin domain-containing protein [Streptomyces xiaopingdaonensis]|uniref:fasciclin domain-containing protein n=1 Tax=Streptomyces xiaopingdaonensis TaxID=1565415 RepID=UPI0002FA9A12|nr:fasciclin domain-containing protein [Streptomyces xiaopingdaonensis]
MQTRTRRTLVALATAGVLPFALTACGSDDDGSDGKSGSEQQEKGGSSQDEGKGQDAGKGGDDMAGKPFGPACASVPDNGKGSFDGMAQDPVATAASNNPELSTLVGAVKKAGLVDTLNSSKDITVFAPTNEAFEKVPEADLKELLGDEEALTEVLTYHVVGEKAGKKQLADGEFTTLQKQKLTTSGSGDSYTVGDGAKIGCGDVQTANATVHIIDSVLMPPE